MCKHILKVIELRHISDKLKGQAVLSTGALFDVIIRDEDLDSVKHYMRNNIVSSRRCFCSVNIRHVRFFFIFEIKVKNRNTTSYCVQQIKYD